MQNYTKTKNFQKTSKTTPERPGTPFKRRGMQNYVGLYSIYAFTTSVERVWVQTKLEKLHNSSASCKHIEKCVKTLKNHFLNI